MKNRRQRFKKKTNIRSQQGVIETRIQKSGFRFGKSSCLVKRDPVSGEVAVYEGDGPGSQCGKKRDCNRVSSGLAPKRLCTVDSLPVVEKDSERVYLHSSGNFKESSLDHSRKKHSGLFPGFKKFSIEVAKLIIFKN
jgi:hypothetical protein